MPERAGTLPYQLLIVNHRERLDDRFLASQIYETTALGQPIGIFVVIEIKSPWHPTRELAEAISQTLLTEFADSPNQSVLTKFESALKRANQVIQGAAEQLETPINATAALVASKEIHFSTIGTNRVLLQRGRSLTDVSPETGQQTFAALTSGDLTPTNLVVLATETLAEAIEALEPLPNTATDIVATIKAEPRPLVGAGVFLRFSPTQPSTEKVFWEDADGRISRPNAVDFGAALGNEQTTQRPTFLSRITAQFGPLLAQLQPLWRSVSAKVRSGWQRLPRRAQLGVAGFALLIIIGLVFFRGAGQSAPAAEIVPTNPLSQVARASDATMVRDLSADFTPERYAALPADDQAIIVRRLQTANITLLPVPAAVGQTAQTIRVVDATVDALMIIDTTGQLWQAKNQSLIQINQKRLISNPVSLTALSETRVVVSDGSGNLWLFDGSADQPLPLALPKELATGTKLLQKFEGNLYTLLPSGEVYRFSAFSDSLAQPTQLTKTGTLPFTEIADFTIPGQFLAVSSTGLLQDFRRNQLGSLKLTLPNLGSGVRLDGLPASTTNGFVSATGRLLSAYLNPPALTGHYFLALPNPITDLAVRSATSLWVASDRDIYQINLP